MEKFFKALANRSRLELIQLLTRGELCVCELETITKMNQANISQHLRILLSTGLVKRRREGQLIFYSLQKEFCQQRVGELHNFFLGVGRLSVELERNLANLLDNPKIDQCKSSRRGKIR